ncbi:Unannotated [Lentimonas sp. CC4]|nr:Unannotated [Lentimonas sp. CC4]CAA6686596.1 Unannotated [Lentimonas sp. CC6]CAA7074872.1 Unannotated [Lentimonas sp. CC4]CAA7169498.1 Unannotated [Lentimonas sp. CC21]CAA7179770.1 Unannotated [Lentimonas sp. CC8]
MRVPVGLAFFCALSDVGALLAKPADVQAVVEEEMVVRRVVVVSKGLWTFVTLRCGRGLREQSPEEGTEIDGFSSSFCSTH